MKRSLSLSWGVAVCTKVCIAHSQLYNENNSKNIEAVGVKIQTKNSFINIVQIYIPPNATLLDRDLECIFKYKNTIVMGDLNCRKREWNCETENHNGKKLLDFCLKKNIIIAAPLNNTNFPPVGKPSIIDLYLFNSPIVHSLPFSINELCSDHN